SLKQRMTNLIIYSFGIIFSYSIGTIFSFNPWVAAIALGVYTFMVHAILNIIGLNRPPGNFFFIMVAAIFITMLTILLAETNFTLSNFQNVILSRLFDILIGSLLGMLGGWTLHNRTV